MNFVLKLTFSSVFLVLLFSHGETATTAAPEDTSNPNEAKSATTAAPEPEVTSDPSEDGNGVKDAFDDALNSLLGLEAEYIAMIGMGIMIVLLVITIIVILCTVGSRRK